MNRPARRSCLTLAPVVLAAVLAAAAGLAAAASAPCVSLAPFNASGIYASGERVGWTVTLAPDASAAAGGFAYTIRRDGLGVIASGDLRFAAGRATIATSLNAPAMLYLEIAPHGGAPCAVAGAAVAPAQLQPVAPRPADFDAFWAAKIQALEAIPAAPVLTPGESGRAGVDYWTIRLDNIGGAHVYGQLAKPAREGKFPAMLVLQWAGGPYPLDRTWVTNRAAEGWLVLNIEPHDVPGNLPAEFYAALPAALKNYTAIGNIDRDRSYFLGMYLGDYRAVDYLASRPDWDGRTLVVTGTSMGGQQSLCVAGLHPRVTDVIVNEPAGCDALAPLHGRAASYPNWDLGDARVIATAPYFDAVNFASRIHARCLIAVGFVDVTARPSGIWTAFNQIPAPKEIVPMIDSPHNNLATAEQQRPWTQGARARFAALAGAAAPAAGAPAAAAR